MFSLLILQEEFEASNIQVNRLYGKELVGVGLLIICVLSISIKKFMYMFSPEKVNSWPFKHWQFSWQSEKLLGRFDWTWLTEEVIVMVWVRRLVMPWLFGRALEAAGFLVWRRCVFTLNWLKWKTFPGLIGVTDEVIDAAMGTCNSILLQHPLHTSNENSIILKSKMEQWWCTYTDECVQIKIKFVCVFSLRLSLSWMRVCGTETFFNNNKPYFSPARN